MEPYLYSPICLHGVDRDSFTILVKAIPVLCRSQWQRGLRYRSAAARMLRSWVRVPPGAWMFVCCECCQVETSATSWSLVQRSPTVCGASLCVIKKLREWQGPGPLGVGAPETNISILQGCVLYVLQTSVSYKDVYCTYYKHQYLTRMCTIRTTNISIIQGCVLYVLQTRILLKGKWNRRFELCVR